jgi:hypothetical protein
MPNGRMNEKNREGKGKRSNAIPSSAANTINQSIKNIFGAFELARLALLSSPYCFPCK